MDKLKKIMIVIIFSISIILILLLAVINIYKKNYEEENIGTEEKVDPTKTVKENEKENEKAQLETENFEYVRILTCLNSYVFTINVDSTSYYGYDENRNYVKIANDETINQNIYNMLSESYIDKKSITIDNVRNYVYKIEENCVYAPISINKKEQTDNVSTYLIYGIIENIEYKNVIESYLILNIDGENKTFSVEQLENKNELDSVKVSKITSVENKGNNVYGDTPKIEQAIAMNYLSNFKNISLGAPEIAYNNFLDDEYKQKRFGSVEKYKEYVEKNKDNIRAINLAQYKAINKDGYTEYIIVDKKGKSYFFKAKSASDYKAILDYYTVETPQFTEAYNKASEEEKVGYNINKCIDSINDFDYRFMYSKLDETFKNNNYPTEESFENAIKEILFEKNKATNLSCSKEGDVYRAVVTIENEDNSIQKRSVTFIMKLEEGIDFVVSFSVE